VGDHESLGPTKVDCSAQQVLGADGTSVHGVTFDTGLVTVYFTSGGRSGGMPVSVSICPIVDGAEYIDQGATYRLPYNEATGDTSATSVQIGSYTYANQEDKYGGHSMKGFVGHQFVTAGAGGAAPQDEADAIINEVLSRLG
jgi:hypothetical protein